MMSKIENYLNRIICGDCLQVMRQLPDKSVDLIITSPPYNLRNTVKGGMSKSKHCKWRDLQYGYSHYDDCMPHNEYVAWQRECLTEMLRVLKQNGAVFYNHKWRVQGGLMQDRQDIVGGFPVRQIIIWQRAGGINFNDNYFLPSYEVIYLIAKSAFRLLPKANYCGDVWRFNQDQQNEHPAPFPVALPERIIGATDAQIILDPFVGSGTTAVATKNLNRQYIGIDLSPDYCEMARARIDGTPIGRGTHPLLDIA